MQWFCKYVCFFNTLFCLFFSLSLPFQHFIWKHQASTSKSMDDCPPIPILYRKVRDTAEFAKCGMFYAVTHQVRPCFPPRKRNREKHYCRARAWFIWKGSDVRHMKRILLSFVIPEMFKCYITKHSRDVGSVEITSREYGVLQTRQEKLHSTASR